jgi:RNase P subunit RPR2
MSESIRMTCPGCGEVQAFEAEQARRPQSCPRCEAFLGIPAEEAEAAPESANSTIVLICPFCDERAAFHTSVAGTSQPCPHCGEEIDVLGSMVEPEHVAHALFFRCDWCHQIVRADEAALESGCQCPLCHETNEANEVISNRITTGQAERLGLIAPPDSEG